MHTERPGHAAMKSESATGGLPVNAVTESNSQTPDTPGRGPSPDACPTPGDAGGTQSRADGTA